jgi:small-conductance mechanosensitive channel
MGTIDRLAATFGLSPEVLWRIAGTLAVLLAWAVIGRLGRRLVARTVDDSAARFQMTRVTGYVIAGAGLFAVARLWIQGITGIATYFGLLSAGIAIALQDPLTNFAGWLFILVRRPFRVGDRIQVGAQTGDVVDIRPLRFVMLEVGNWVHADQGTGRILHVPNGFVFKNSVANYDEAFGYIWNELELTVTYESDWRLAKEILEEILLRQSTKIDDEVKKRIDEAAHTLHIKFPKLTPVVWTTVVSHGVCLTMRYLCKPRARRSSASQIWEQVLDAFADVPSVDFAYPTTRRFDNVTEGKAEARAMPPSHVAPAAKRD